VLDSTYRLTTVRSTLKALNENLGRRSWTVGRSYQWSVHEERWEGGVIGKDLKDCSQRANTVASQQLLPMVDGVAGIRSHVS
jgi:hypothetical protein